MKTVRLIVHLFTPHHSNNHKAKLIQSSFITIFSVFLILIQLGMNLFSSVGPKILGYAANIDPNEVIRLTNEKRAQSGLPPLEMNPTLNAAALAKGTDMINKDYWAHVAPDGTQPWKFFTEFGYKYRYAGENLARDFSNPSSAVDAWMASPSHKENLLSANYKEIGVAVVEGDMAGVDTTIIVQFFGTKYVDTVPAVPVARAETVETPTPVPTQLASQSQQQPAPIALISPSPTSLPSPTTSLAMLNNQNVTNKSLNPIKLLISPFTTTRSISLTVVCLLLAVLVLDGVMVSKRNITRIAGRSFAHMAFMGMVLVIVLILKAGQVI